MQSFTGLKGLLLSLGTAGPAAGVQWPAEVVVSAKEGRKQLLEVKNTDSKQAVLGCTVQQGTAWRAGSSTILVTNQGPSQAATAQQQVVVTLSCSSQQQAQQLWQALQPPPEGAAAATMAQATAAAENGPAPGQQGGSSGDADKQQQQDDEAGNRFDAKTDKASADLYFHYYGMIMHQQNMLQDMTRTGTYHAAIVENRVDFEGKTVMDVGAGSGILSLFAAQAGAAKVYAVEASGMATFARKLAEKNPVGKVIQVCHSKVEELQLPGDCQVDVLVSEPMGTLLVNERMLETYIYARDRFLKPGGKMFPHLGRVHAALFSDPVLHSELLGKAVFWQQASFYGIDMTALHMPAVDGYFAQVVVDAFDPSALVSDCATRVFDFSTMKEEELHDINIPINLTVAHPCTLHGIACWFDVLFNGSSSQRWLSTAPGLPTTHWFQLRCCLQQPLLVLAPNSQVTGSMRLVAHERQSYDVHLELVAPPISPGMPTQRSAGKFDMKEPYYRQLTTWATQQTVQAASYFSPAPTPGVAVPGQPTAQQGPLASLTPAAVAAALAISQQPQQPQQQQQLPHPGTGIV